MRIGTKEFAAARRWLAAALALMGITAVRGTEGGMGRPITAQQIVPFAGALPPEPGLSLSAGTLYYNGKFSGNRPLPLDGSVTLNLDTQLVLNPLSALLVWNLRVPRWNFASAITFPLAWKDVSADVQVGPGTVHRTDDNMGLYDILLTPFMASCEVGANKHLSLTSSVWVPSGDYNKNKLANLGLHVWTFVNTAAYTMVLPQQNLEFSFSAAVELYTENLDTRYENGALTRFELLTIKRTGSGFGFGVVGGAIWQIESDKGALADRLGGFPGRSFAAGPIIAKTWKLDRHMLSLDARWVFEFDTKNRPEGDSGSINVAFTF